MPTKTICFNSNFKTRAEPSGSSDKKFIEGYFVVYESETQLFPKWYETVAKGAGDNAVKDNDIRCLFNHNRDIVLGRKDNGTLQLKSDNVGVWGCVEINQNDRQAMDIYERVKRGDINTCSFGFNDSSKETYTYEYSDDGTIVHCRIEVADIIEISICPFPAYEDTEISARSAYAEANQTNSLKVRKACLKNRLEAIKNAKTN